MLNVGKIFSTLGNPNSLVPLTIKDMAATTGMTVSSFATGKEEGEDRLIDELGTQAIWLGSIPGYKWIFNKTVFKWFGFDHKFDVRNLKNQDIFEKVKQYAPTDEIKKNMEKISKKQPLFKNISLYRFLVSTSLAVVTYIGLTKAKQAYTENKIKKNLIDEFNKKKQEDENNKKKIDSENPNFKGMGEIASKFAFSSVNNMWILDAAITAERLHDSRSTQELIGYAIKEASTLCFMYYAGGKIQNYLENRATQKYNKSIGLDAVVLEEGSLKRAFDNGTIINSIEKFKNADKSDTTLYEFLYNNPDNEVIKAAKQTEIIKMYKNTEKIDTREYIDLESLRGVNKKVETLYEQYQQALKKGETSEQFFKNVKKLKRHSILTGMGSCMFVLGVVTPTVILAKRLFGKNDAEFKTKSEIREKLIKDGVIS